jgi:hypothetical protein
MSYKIPLFDLNYDEQEEKAIVETLKSRWISTGPKCQELEGLFCDALNTKYALTTSSCTAALHLGLWLLNIIPHDTIARQRGKTLAQFRDQNKNVSTASLKPKKSAYKVNIRLHKVFIMN